MTNKLFDSTGWSRSAVSEMLSRDYTLMGNLLHISIFYSFVWKLSQLSKISTEGAADILRTELKATGKPLSEVFKQLEYKILRNKQKKG